MNQIKECLFGLFLALVMLAIIYFGHWVDFIPEQPDYFIGVVR